MLRGSAVMTAHRLITAPSVEATETTTGRLMS